MSAVGATGMQTIGRPNRGNSYIMGHGSWVMGHVGHVSVHGWVIWVTGHKT